jgi:hypothetical protein
LVSEICGAAEISLPILTAAVARSAKNILAFTPPPPKKKPQALSQS